MKIVNFIIMIVAVIATISCVYALIISPCSYFNYVYLITMIIAMMIGGHSFEKILEK